MTSNYFSVTISSIFVTQIRTYGSVRAPLHAKRLFNFIGIHADRAVKWLNQLFFFTSYHRTGLFPAGPHTGSQAGSPLFAGLDHAMWCRPICQWLNRFWVHIFLQGQVSPLVREVRGHKKLLLWSPTTASEIIPTSVE